MKYIQMLIQSATGKMIGIFSLLLVIFIAAVTFDVNYLSFRTLYSLFFVIFVPGYLLYLLIGRVTADFLKTALYSSALGIMYLMLLGLVLNFGGFYAGFEKPLDRVPVLLAISVSSIALLLVVIWQKKLPKSLPRILQWTFINGLLSALSVGSLLFVFFGANLLNNKVESPVTAIGIAFISILVFCTILLGKRVSNGTYIVMIVSFSMYFVYMVNLRSHFLYGSDNVQEYVISTFTHRSLFWDWTLFDGGLYNKCLSITILPSLLATLSGTTLLDLYKSIFPVFFGLLPLGIYALASTFHSRLAGFIAAIFFVANSAFWGNMSTHYREGFSLIFFVMVLLVLAETHVKKIPSNILILLLGIGAIVSHYSTAFIMLLWITVFIFFEPIVKIVPYITPQFLKNRFKKVFKNTTIHFNLNVITLIVLWIIFFTWYTGPNRGNAFIDNIGSLVANLQETVTEQIRADRSSVQDLLNVEYTTNEVDILYETYGEIIERNPNTQPYPWVFTKDHQLTHVPQYILPETFTNGISDIVITLGEIFKRTGLLLMGLGVLFTLSFAYKNYNGKVLMSTFYAVAAVLLLSSIVLPVVSVSYNIGRVYIQTLVVLSIAFSLGLIWITSIVKPVKLPLIALYMAIHIIVFTGALYDLVGGVAPAIQFRNKGQQYQTLYTHTSELASSKWVSQYTTKDAPILPDSYNRNKVLQHNYEYHVLVFPILTAQLIPENAYIYFGHANTVDDISHGYFRSTPIGYRTPETFLELYKNRVYTNGYSEIYK